jgi:hypothetical protein
MGEHSLETELYREYDFNGRIYRIDNPAKLVTVTNGTTHRVIDSDNVVHCVPAPGVHGCVLRWKSKANLNPVAF